ncbi:MAG: hypothetical protein IH624_05535 [Phycisphaerae bacterium]|nr:hypothetical protein [Phycisphaerae bacterium]
MNEFAGPRISVIDPISSAMARTKLILFQPFNLDRWFLIGFCAWLADLTRPGGPSFSYRNSSHSTEQIGAQITQHLPIIIFVGAVLLTIGLAVTVVLLWLSSRGRFMFFHCVAENRDEVKAPWRKYRQLGNSLFLFRLALMFIVLFCSGLLIAAAIILGITLRHAAGPLPISLIAVAGIPLLVIIAVAFAVIEKFAKDFIVPLMALRNCTCTVAWQEFLDLLGANKGRFALYLLFQIALTLAVAALLFLVALATCCCAGCIIMIPYLGTVLLLPVHVFTRSYSLLYLAQYGPAYDAIAATAPEPQPQPEQEPEQEPRSYTPPPIQGL